MASSHAYIQFFGSDSLRRLHGCGMAEALRGGESACHGLAQPDRRPQVGFGRPSARILFLSPRPIDPESAGNEAFNEWLEREAELEHHLTSHSVQPYFTFVRSVFRDLRKRLQQPFEKHDPLELAFHSWMVRCATQNPDRVTDGAVDQCSQRHLEALVKAMQPAAIVALGGTAAHYFWSRSGKSWESWRPVDDLHGERLQWHGPNGEVPVILSVNPDRDEDAHPEVIARGLSQVVKAEDLEPRLAEAA
jgi:uracil-DNA glycosylase